MGFNLYFAGAENLAIPLTKDDCCGKLFTFAVTAKRLDKFVEGSDCKLFIDSGAFSMYHSGVNIDIDEYIEYINNRPNPTIWAELDAIPYPELNTESSRLSSNKSWENYLYMMKRIKPEYQDKVIPVYHLGEPYEALERILNTEVEGRLTPYIGVGGRHGFNKKHHDRYFGNLFQVVKKSKNPNVKIHAFGMTVLELLEKYPFYSADSTTWLMIGANGGVITKTCGIIAISELSKKKGSFWNMPEMVYKALEEEIISKGFTVEQLSTDYKARHSFNALYFIEWAKNYTYKGSGNIRRKKLF